MTQTKFLVRFCSPPSCVHPPPWARAGLSWCISFTCSVCALRCSVVSDSLGHCGLRPPGSAVHGVFQARILEGVAFPFSRGSSQPQAWTPISCISCIHLLRWEVDPLPLGHLGSPSSSTKMRILCSTVLVCIFLCLDFWLRILRLHNSYCIHQ